MARYAREWSREHLAEETGLSVEQIDAIENGFADPTPVLAALRLDHIELLLPAIGVNFLKTVVPIAQRIESGKLPLALAAVTDILGRAATVEDVGRRHRRSATEGHVRVTSQSHLPTPAGKQEPVPRQ